MTTPVDGIRTIMEKKRHLLLLVDDDERTANLLGRLLEDEGYDAEVAVDGASRPHAGTGRADHRFHLPIANGLAVARVARKRRPGMPVFVVTGYPQSLAPAAESGDEPVVVMTKPLNCALLVRRLGIALSGRVAV